MKTLRLPFVVAVSVCFFFGHAKLCAQSGGGANTGGDANTVEGTGRGAGGPGDGEGPGQGAGQGLGPGGRDNKPDSDPKDKSDRDQDEKPNRSDDDTTPEKPDRRDDEDPKKDDGRDKPDGDDDKPADRPNKRDESDEPRGPGGDDTDKPASPLSDGDGPAEERSVPGIPENTVPENVVPGNIVPSDVPGVPGSAGSVDSAVSNIPSVDTLTGGAVDTSSVQRFLGIFPIGPKKSPSATTTTVVTDGKSVVALERSGRARSGPAFFGFKVPEVPNLVQAAKVSRVSVDPRVSSPRSLTYKSRLSRVSRWIGPLTLGLLNYVPFETMNDSVSGRVNNLMAEEKISIEPMVAKLFAAEIRETKRFSLSRKPEAVFELEMTRYALDPTPTSLSRVKPTVSITGRLYDLKGQLLWIGKGFSTVAEKGLKGATVEQYEADPDMLRGDFEKAAAVAVDRLSAQTKLLPKATVKVVPSNSRD